MFGLTTEVFELKSNKIPVLVNILICKKQLLTYFKNIKKPFFILYN